MDHNDVLLFPVSDGVASPTIRYMLLGYFCYNLYLLLQTESKSQSSKHNS